MPGETYYTLKEKATQQAKKSGMSQTAAENYGSAMASQSAQVGGAVDPKEKTFDPEFFGGTDQTYGNISSEIQKALSGSGAAPLEQIAARQAAEKKMQEEGGVYNPQTGQVIYPEKKDDIFQTIQNILHGVAGDAGKMVGLLPNILKGAQSTDRFFKALAEKGAAGLSPEDKIILANLIAANKENPAVLGDIDYKKYDVKDVKGFESDLDKAIDDLENMDYQSLIDQYETGKPTGLSGFFDVGEGRTDGITLEQLKDDLGPEGLAFLKANDPKKYYSFTQPQTTGSLEELAGMDATQYPGTDLAQQIFDARQEVDRQRDAGGGGGGAGIPSLYAGPITPSDSNAIVTQPGEITYPEGYGAFLLNPPPTIRPGTPTVQGFPDADGDGIDDRWQAGPGIARPGIEGIEGIEGPLTTTAAATTPTPFDYSQWPQFGPQYPGYNQYSGPNYVNQGLGQGPQFDYWNQIANTFPGMS